MLDLKSGGHSLSSEFAPIAAVEASAAETFADAVRMVRRQVLIVILLGLLGAAGGVFYFLHAPQKYTATATLLINTRKMEIFQQPAVAEDLPMQAVGAVESQVELLMSEEVARRVVKKLDLSQNDRFVGNEPGLGLRTWLHTLAPGYFGESQALTAEERQNIAVGRVEENLSVERVGVTYAIEIKFQSRYPDIAANVTNAVAEAYIDLQRSSGYDAARRASDWLEERIPELRAKSEAAQQAVSDYKRAHNIVETESGKLIEDQRLDDANKKLNDAREETLKAKDRRDQIAAVSGGGGSSETSSGSKDHALGTELLDRLRAQYQELSSKEADASTKLGPNNLTIVSLRNQKAELRTAITEELQRLKQVDQDDYVAAQVREAAAKKEFDAAVAQSQQAKEAQVKMRELEASARAYQDLYNTYIDRYNASLQQAVSPVAEASVINSASPNIKRDYKKTIQVAAFFPIAGLMLGAGIAVLRELLGGRVFLTSKSVQARLRVPCIGLLPKVRQGREAKLRARQAQADSGPRTLRRGDRGVGWTVVDDPFSHYSEGVRSIKLAIDMDNRSKKNRVVGLTSAVPDEGKSTVAISVAQMFASNGVSVILVDCDIRNPTLTRAMAPGAKRGIVDVAFGRASLDDVIWKDPATQLAFLPAVPHAGPPDPPTVLLSAELRRLFDELRNRYQYVIVDLSPLAPVIDVSATTEFVDSYVFVIEYGKTTVDLIMRALRAAPAVSDSIIGAVLNKADLKTLATYDSYMTNYYFNKGDG